MTIEALKKQIEVCQKYPSYHGVNSVPLKLYAECLIEIMERLELGKTKEIEPEPEIKEEGIDLIAFYVQTSICHPSSLAKLLTGNPEFRDKCGERRGKKYFVKPEATIKYLSTCINPKFRNSALRFLKTRQEKLCPTPSQPTLPLLIS